MPHVVPIDHPLTKLLPNLAVSVTYTQVSGSPNELDCTIEIRNTNERERKNSSCNSNYEKYGKDSKNDKEVAQDGNEIDENDNEIEENEGDDEHYANDGNEYDEESQKLTSLSKDVSIFLGYIQLVGYVRLNNDFAGNGLSRDLFWKNDDYSSRYPIENEHDKVEAILQTPLFNEKDSLCSFKNKLAGWPDFKTGPSDATSVDLLHDLAHSFNSGEPLGRQWLSSGDGRGAEGRIGGSGGGGAAVTLQEAASISTEFSQCIVPFYVTLQHLLFSSTKIRPGETEKFTRRVQIPGNELPPSYNTDLTGFHGENGLVSICYHLVVGLSDENASGLALRNLYFPWRFSAAQIRTERGWSQPNYLQKPIVDKDWLPQVISPESSGNGSLQGQRHQETVSELIRLTISDETANNKNDKIEDLALKAKQSAAKEKLKAELANLMSSTVEMVATTERRKSSVSISKRDENGYIPQIPAKSRVSYQIKVNNQFLCQALMSKATYRVGEDVHFCLDVPSAKALDTRVVGAVAHIEAHEVFHVDETRKLVNVYKVTPAIKVNTYANALAISSEEGTSSAISSMLNLPLYLAQQFQASTLMDLKYFLVFSLVLNDFDTENLIISIDQEDEKAVSEYLQVYKTESEFHKFKFSVPLTVMP